MPTAASHISCVLRWLGISFIQRGIASYRVILIYITGSGEGQNMPWGVAFVSDNLKQLSVTSTTFLSVFFSSSGTHLDGCQPIGINVFLIYAFWALRF